MTETITKPTRKQLTALFARALETADAGGRTRTLCGFDPAGMAERVMRTKRGLYEQDGGGVANAYKYPAQSSAVGIVWYTRPDRVKVVRVAAARIGVSGRHVSSLNLGTRAQQEKLTAAGMHAVLVDRLLMAVYSDSIPGAEGFVKAIKKNLAAVTPWLVLADWLCDQGRGSDYQEPVSYRRLPAPDAEIAAAIQTAFATPVVA